MAYFIAQFGRDDYIHPAEEVDSEETERPFRALLQVGRFVAKIAPSQSYHIYCVLIAPSQSFYHVF